jgi:fructose/tagatose bisphosphate aldolase
MKQWLEMEIGITGGEEDGVNNEDVDNASLYTQPEDILEIYNRLSKISPYFSIAAGFGNVHGVYVSLTRPISATDFDNEEALVCQKMKAYQYLETRER